MTQQARHLSRQIHDGSPPVRFLLRDRDSKFPAAFDTVFTSEDVTSIRTPVRAPNANAVAERWIRSAREECVDKLLILNERHLQRVLTTYVGYHNRSQPHQGIGQHVPEPEERSHRSLGATGKVIVFPVFGGLHHEYRRAA